MKQTFMGNIDYLSPSLLTMLVIHLTTPERTQTADQGLCSHNHNYVRKAGSFYQFDLAQMVVG